MTEPQGSDFRIWGHLFGVLLALLCSGFRASGQCLDSAVPIRLVDSEVKGTGLVQRWEFLSPDRYSMIDVAVNRAYWLGEDEVLLWGQWPSTAEERPSDPCAGLFLLKNSESFGMRSWRCSWQSGLVSDSLGEYRALVPVSVLQTANYRLIVVDVQDETSIGTVLVLFRDGVLVAEQHLWLTTMDPETGNWVAPCATLDSAGRVYFPADQIYAMWSGDGGAEVYAGRELTWSPTHGLVPANVIFAASTQRGVYYRVTPFGYVVLGQASKVPSGNRLAELAGEIAARHGLEEVRLFRSDAALGAAWLGDVAARDAGFLGMWRAGEFRSKWE